MFQVLIYSSSNYKCAEDARLSGALYLTGEFIHQSTPKDKIQTILNSVKTTSDCLMGDKNICEVGIILNNQFVSLQTIVDGDYNL